ncbi:MAG: Gfo/Idh/MocA family oxidoreductase [Victivallaceae bacterium]|nr:Gfo/Idh/MocA family oxidoreductase [Victivallaceae bacterium]
MAKLKAGVIGLGMGSNHLRGYLTHPDVEVVAVADRLETKRAMARDEFHIPHIYEEGADMIAKEKLDLISVAVPNRSHHDLTIAALRSGANVLCEKPMAMNAEEAREMLDTAKACGKKLGINFSYRFSAQSMAMKALVDAGKLGEIYYARSVWLRRRGIPGLGKGGFNTEGAAGVWFFDKKFSGGGPLIDLGVHRLDLALWLMGYPEAEYVMGSTYCKLAPEIVRKSGDKYSVEDLACAMIKFKNGATLELDASWACNIAEREQMSTRLLGEKGGLYQENLNEGYTFTVDYYQELGDRQFDCRLHEADAPKSSYYLFADAVKNGTDFLVRPEEGVTVMKLLDAIYRSAATGMPVKLS